MTSLNSCRDKEVVENRSRYSSLGKQHHSDPSIVHIVALIADYNSMVSNSYIRHRFSQHTYAVLLCLDGAYFPYNLILSTKRTTLETEGKVGPVKLV